MVRWSLVVPEPTVLTTAADDLGLSESSPYRLGWSTPRRLHGVCAILKYTMRGELDILTRTFCASQHWARAAHPPYSINIELPSLQIYLLSPVREPKAL